MENFLNSTILAALIAAITTMLGFFINEHIARRRNEKQELKQAYGEVISSARNIRRTLIVFHEFNISFRSMMHMIRERDASSATELEIQKQAAFNYEEKANNYRDILTTQQGQLDKAFFILIGTEKNHLIKRWKNKPKDKDDNALQTAVEKILSYKEDADTFEDAKYSVDTYFDKPLKNIQRICSNRMRDL
ncbi:hypothetical protein KDA08_05995 [Candidatus Saccharibacteria bacterium]|nr:hypothetical protein [Candidatus Saccharibacteria bacterium]